jgi:hypothetical protein
VVGAFGAIPTGLGQGTAQVYSVLDLGGFDTAVNVLVGGATVTNSAAAGTNTITLLSDTTNFTGLIQDNPSGAGISLCISNSISYGTEGLVKLQSTQSYRGQTHLSAGSLLLCAPNVLPTNSVLNSGVANLYGAVFLNGFDQTIAGLTGDGAGVYYRYIANGSSNNCTLTINVPMGQSCLLSNTMGIALGNLGWYTNDIYNPVGAFNVPDPIAAGLADNFNVVKEGAGLECIVISYYTGPTTIKAGTFVFRDFPMTYGEYVTNTVTVESGATLAGNGRQILGPVTVESGATLRPGLDLIGIPGIYNLTISNSLVLETNSTTFTFVDKDINKNDVIKGMSNVMYGGNLIVTNTGVTNNLAVGDTYQLFSATGSITGNFSSITILPATGLYGVFNPTNGILTITNVSGGSDYPGIVAITQIPTVPTNIMVSVSASRINLSWPASYLGWSLQTQTNILNTNWVTIPGSSLMTTTNFPILNGNQAVFFRMFYNP